jgi:hypothetical protein
VNDPDAVAEDPVGAGIDWREVAQPGSPTPNSISSQDASASRRSVMAPQLRVVL